MAHVYDVTLANGETYTVTIEKHHDDHPQNVFVNSLLDILKGAGKVVVGNGISRYIYRGRK